METETCRYPRAPWLTAVNRCATFICIAVDTVACVSLYCTLKAWQAGISDNAPTLVLIELGFLILAFLTGVFKDRLTTWLYDRLYRRKNGHRVYEEFPLSHPFWQKFARRYSEVSGYGFSADVYYLHGSTHLQEGNRDDAFIYFCCAAALGHAASLFYIGTQLINGDGLLHNWRKGLELIRKSALAGSQPGIICMGCLCYDGHFVPQDLNEAARWLPLGEELNDPESIFRLGMLYHNGICVEHDSERALGLFYHAANLGHTQAARMVNKLS